MLSDSNPSSTPKNVPWNKGRLTGQKRPPKPKRRMGDPCPASVRAL